jgi:TetR/AcrR family transcriptional repressor of bet genes
MCIIRFLSSISDVRESNIATKSTTPAYRRLSEDERQDLLIDATIAVLSESGLSGATVRKIAAAAGVTPGLVTHHFAGKDALISAAYRRLAEQFHTDYVAASEAAGNDPVERLQAFVGSAFQPQTLNRNLLRVWTSFWDSALTAPDSEPAKVHYETAQRTRAYVEQLLRDALLSRGHELNELEIRQRAIAIGSLVDGMWLTWGLDPSLFDAATGRRIAFDMLAAYLAIPTLVD